MLAWLRHTHLGVAVCLTLALTGLAAADISMERYAPRQGAPAFKWCTQVYFANGLEIAVDFKQNRLLYRHPGEAAYQPSPLALSHPHSLAYNTHDGLYYLNDTDNNRILAFNHPGDSQPVAAVSHMAGIALKRPHDIVIDPDSGWIYTINPLRATVFRFKGFGRQEQRLKLGEHLGYSRALSFFEGKLYVVGSTVGKVVEIVDFKKGDYRVYSSFGKKKVTVAGNWERSGLVLNDVEHYGGYWYASSYFCPAASHPGQDYNRNKLIRFKTWHDFETGQWEDLSAHLPDALLPYYLTVYNGQLYFPLFNNESPGEGEAIYRLTAE